MIATHDAWSGWCKMRRNLTFMLIFWMMGCSRQAEVKYQPGLLSQFTVTPSKTNTRRPAEDVVAPRCMSDRLRLDILKSEVEEMEAARSVKNPGGSWNGVSLKKFTNAQADYLSKMVRSLNMMPHFRKLIVRTFHA